MSEEIVPTTSKIEHRRQIAKAADVAGPTIKQFADAMIEAKGNASRMATILNLPPEVVRRKIKVTPELRRIKNNIMEARLDNAEDKLADQVDSGNITAITYTLNNLGKERGYGKGQDHVVDVNVNHSAGLIERLRKKSGTDEEWDEDQIAEVEEYEWVEESEDD